MTSHLQQVLDAFTRASGSVSLTQLARELSTAPEMLESMVVYWVHQGRLREVVDETNCAGCGAARSCPFVTRLPRRYELVEKRKQQGNG